MAVLFLTLTVFLFAVLAMSVGIIFRRPCLRGSCGGSEVLDGSGEPLTCATCPHRERDHGAANDDGVGGSGLQVLR